MMKSPKMLYFQVLVTYIIFASLISIKGVDSSCYPDKKEVCDKKSKELDGTWNTTMRFFLFTRRNHKDPEQLHMCNGRLPKFSNFNPNNSLAIFIPGFLFGVCELEVIREIKDELLAKEDLNVILIDNTYEIGVDIVDAKKRMLIIAKVIVNVLQNIQDVTNIENDKIYIMGHSFGAHIAGSIGSIFKIHRITGIDAAGVLFTKKTPLNERLDPSDADLVDIIHCNGGNGLPYFGISFPSGHADFYVNGGTEQPSCTHSAWEALKHLSFAYAIGSTTVPTICAHAQCLEFYKLSINNKAGKFIAWDCDNYDDFKNEKCTGKDAKPVVMGYDFEKNFTQVYKSFPQNYYLETSDTWPFVTSNGTFRSGN